MLSASQKSSFNANKQDKPMPKIPAKIIDRIAAGVKRSQLTT
jgi:hypothetical protein